jgi:hypothetical protein
MWHEGLCRGSRFWWCFLIGTFHTSSKFRPHRLLGARAADLHAAVAAVDLRPSQGQTCRAGWELAPTLRAPHHRRRKASLDSGSQLYALLANRLRPAHAIERSTTYRFGMTANPVCPDGFSINIQAYRRVLL